jgi:carbamoyltransferase
VGPRALCNRSILADPSDPTMKDKINKTIKHREPWRPFAPSIAIEDLADYVEDPSPSPFMILAFQTKADKLDKMVSAIHVDGTCRPQSVDRRTNPRMWQLLQEWKSLTGLAAILNTSFNDNDEPIVCSPRDALKTFLASDIDYVALGDYLVWKDGTKDSRANR